MAKCSCRLPFGQSAVSIPTIIANVSFVLALGIMALVGHPQCAVESQVPFTQKHAATLQGWVLAMLAAAVCGIYISGASVNTSQVPGRALLRVAALERFEQVRVHVTQAHLHFLGMVIFPGALLTLLISAFPNRVCLMSEVRVLIIGATFCSSTSASLLYKMMRFLSSRDTHGCPSPRYNIL
jgi:hypothetical protein